MNKARIDKVLATSDINPKSLELVTALLNIDIPEYIDGITSVTIFPEINNNLDRLVLEVLLTVDYIVHLRQFKGLPYEEALLNGLVASVSTLLNLPMEHKDVINWLLEMSDSHLSLDNANPYLISKIKEYIDIDVLQLNNAGCVPLTWHDDALVVLIHESIPASIEFVLERMPSNPNTGFDGGDIIDIDICEEEDIHDELFGREL